MSLSITNTTSALNSARTNLANVPQGVKDDVKALAKALRSGDLPAARQAYVDLAKQAPEGATLQPGSAFATLGKALAGGDVAAAKTAFASLLRGQIDKPADKPATTDPVKPEPPVSLPPTVSSTGGSAGSTLNAVA